MWGGHFVTWAKQAKPLGFFDLVQSRVVNGGEAGSVEASRALGPDYPFGIWGNSYDLASYEGQPDAHKKYIERIKAYTKEDPPSTWPITVYVAMQFLVEGIKKAGSVDSDKVAKALLDLTIDTPFGKQTLRASDHQADRGQFYGKMIKGPDRQRDHDGSQIRGSQAVHELSLLHDDKMRRSLSGGAFRVLRHPWEPALTRRAPATHRDAWHV